MKPSKAMVLLTAVLALSLLPGVNRSEASTGFDKLKSLVGEWEGKTASGNTVRASYKLVSAGTSLMETLAPAGEADMVTLYHSDGDRLMLTHYCAADNQPRMRAEKGGEPNTLSFSFVDATNLASAAGGHMHKLVLAFKDNDHFSQTWTWREKGQDRDEVFHFTRKK